MPPKKAKAQKMALTDFFANTASGSWVDDDDDVPLAPAKKDPSAPKRGDPGYLDSMPDRGPRTFPGAPPEREQLPLPTAPPFTAFVGNLTFETEEPELMEFFSDLSPVTSRLVKQDGKSKGFGYVEFGSQDKLKTALERSGSQLGGRTVRISVAEAPSSSRRDYPTSAADENSQWRRSGPLPTIAPTPSMRRGPSFASPSEPQPERDWSAARGSKFTPSPSTAAPSYGNREGFSREGSGYGLNREGSGPGRHREDLPPSQADEASAWRSSKPAAVTPVAVGVPGIHGGERASGQSSPGLADTESTWSRGTKLRTPVTEAPNRSTTASPDERDWSKARSQQPESRQASTEGEPAPTERKRLNLAPRSASTSTPDPASPAATASPTRSSIFGGAQPIDSAAKEAAAASKLAAQDRERKAAAAKAREEEEKKAKAAAEEKAREEQKMILQIQEEAFREAGLTKEEAKQAALIAAGGAVPGQPGSAGGAAPGPGFAGRGRGGGPGGRGRGDMRRTSGEVRGAGRGGASHINTAGAGRGDGPTSPRRTKEPPTPKFDADGFEIAQSGRGGRSVGTAPGGAQAGAGAANAAPNGSASAGQGLGAPKKGFSFSAAMAQGFDAEGEDEEGEGEADEEGEGEEETNGRNGEQGVDEATRGVQEVKV